MHIASKVLEWVQHKWGRPSLSSVPERTVHHTHRLWTEADLFQGHFHHRGCVVTLRTFPSKQTSIFHLTVTETELIYLLLHNKKCTLHLQQLSFSFLSAFCIWHWPINEWSSPTDTSGINSFDGMMAESVEEKGKLVKLLVHMQWNSVPQPLDITLSASGNKIWELWISGFLNVTSSFVR